MNAILLAGDAQPGQYFLHLRQDSVVPAAGTPFDFLRSAEIISASNKRGRLAAGRGNAVLR